MKQKRLSMTALKLDKRTMILWKKLQMLIRSFFLIWMKREIKLLSLESNMRNLEDKSKKHI